jgi:hypothetical protein
LRDDGGVRMLSIYVKKGDDCGGLRFERWVNEYASGVHFFEAGKFQLK